MLFVIVEREKKKQVTRPQNTHPQRKKPTLT